MKFEERLKIIRQLSLEPFKPEALIEEMEKLKDEIPQLSREDLERLKAFMEELKPRLEENYRICFGWIEETFKKGYRRQA